jgi:hypothetical protein
MKVAFKNTVSAIIIALALVSISVTSVFAAPPHDPPLPADPELEQAWAVELSRLATELAFFNNFRPIVALSVNPANQRRQLDMYRAAISAAETLVINQTGFDDQGHVTNSKRANEAVQELDDYLTRIRGLKEKLGAGRTLVIATAPSISSDDLLRNIAIQQEWAAKRDQLAAEIMFFIRFRTMPGRCGTDANQGKYLDMYRSAIIAAQAILVKHDGFDASRQVIDADRASQALKQLADALHMIRGLKEKLGRC